MLFGLFIRPIPFRAQIGQAGRPYIELPDIDVGDEKAVLRALKGMGRVRMRTKSNDFGHITVEFRAGFDSYTLHNSSGAAFIRGEGDAEIAAMLRFMRKSRRFEELPEKK